MQDFRRHFGIAIRWLPLVLVCAFGTSALAYGYFAGQPKMYESTSHLIVEPGPGASSADLAVASDTAVVYAREVGSLPFAAGVIRDLGLDDSPRDFVQRISTEIDADSLVLSVSAKAGEAQQARRIAKGVGDSLIAEVRADLITPEVRDADAAIDRNERLITQLNRQRLNLQRKANKTFEERVLLQNLAGQITNLEQSIIGLRPYSSTNVRNLLAWFQQPRVPSGPVEPRPLYWAGLALVAGGMLGVLIALVLAYVRNVGKVHDDRDLELATGQVTLGSVFEAGRDMKRKDPDRLVMMHYPRSGEAGAYRGLVAKIGFNGAVARTLMVTSPTPSDSKSLVAANIAVAYAEAGRNVILVDADYRAPRIHSYFGVRNERGLTTVLSDSSASLGWTTVPSSHPRLGLMTSGPVPRENAEPLGSIQLNTLVRRLLQAADLVVFDSPAIESSLDAAVLAGGLDGTVLVVPKDVTGEQVAEAARALQSADSEFVGAVLYRKVRRSRRGARAKVPPAPEGWGPTWPMMYEQPARIPAATRSAGQETRLTPAYSRSAVRPTELRPAPQPPPQPAPQPQAPPQPQAAPQPGWTPGSVPAQGPYFGSFRSPPSLRKEQVDPTPPGPAPTDDRPPSAPTPVGQPSTAKAGTNGSATPAPAQGASSTATKVVIPVKPGGAEGARPAAQPAASSQADPPRPQTATQPSPESVPG